MKLSFWLWGILIAFGGGCLVCLLNYALSRTVLRKKPSLFSVFTIIRQVFNIGYLVALYLVASLTPWNRVHLLVGGALGVTLPMIYFTAKLVRLSDGDGKEESSGKTDNDNETEAEKHG